MNEKIRLSSCGHSRSISWTPQWTRFVLNSRRTGDFSSGPDRSRCHNDPPRLKNINIHAVNISISASGNSSSRPPSTCTNWSMATLTAHNFGKLKQITVKCFSRFYMKSSASRAERYHAWAVNRDRRQSTKAKDQNKKLSYRRGSGQYGWWNGYSKSSKVIRCCANRRGVYDFLLPLNSNLTSIFNRSW